MTEALPLAMLLVLLVAITGLLGWTGARQSMGGARIRLRAHAIADAGRQGGRRLVLREKDPLLGGTARSRADIWLQENVAAARWMDERLAAAGVTVSLSHCVGGGLAGVMAMIVLLLIGGLEPGSAMLIAVCAGVLAPLLWLRFRISRRRKAFEALLPEAIGLMVRGLRAGFPVSETVAEVAAEVIDPLGGAFRRAYEQVRLGQPLEAALHAETASVDSASMRFLIVTLSVQRETGGNLAETLEKLDAIVRGREHMQMKVKAMASEARASALIIGSLPLVMGALMLAIAPDYVLPLFTTTAGQVLLGAAVMSLATGGWLMAQLVAFEV